MNNKLILVVIAVIIAGIVGGSWYAKRKSYLEKSQPPSVSSVKLSETEARSLAEGACVKGGEALARGYYNENSRTWWFDANLNSTRPGCHPACVVSEDTKAAEVNWRCMGLKDPHEGDILPRITNFKECAAVGNQITQSSPRQCQAGGLTFIEEAASAPHEANRKPCLPDQRRAEVCAEVYDPVCALVQVQCIRAPCPPVPQTFSNSCEACRNSLVESYASGACAE